MIKAGLVLTLAGVAAAAIAAAPGLAGPRAQAARTVTVAAISSIDYRAAVIARRTSSGSAPTARVDVEVSTRSGGAWRPARTRALRGVYFWNTISRPHSVCQLAIDTTGGAAHRPQLVVRLLVSPSLGCGRAQSIALPAA